VPSSAGRGVVEPPFRGDQSDGQGSSAGVPEPYRVTFPFDAPYNGPYPGGAAWPGGPSRHRGVDLALPGPDNGRGTAYGAFQPGTVEALIPESADPAGGNGILIRTDGGLYNYYGHNDRFLVRAGEHVDAGEHIGVLGRSGLDPGMQTHLHYEVRRGINGDPVGQTIDPVPYMRSGGAATPGQQPRRRGGRIFEFDLFGQHFVFQLPGEPEGMDLIRAIEQLGAQIGGRDFGRAAAAIALSEGADGDLSQRGSGGARGPFQFDPGGELQNYARYLHESIEQAGDDAGQYPLEAAGWALKGYLGDALRSGLDQDPPLKGADLAEWGSYYGQRPAGDLWRRAGDASRQLYGYRHGAIVERPHLLVDADSGRISGMMAEAGPEGIVPLAGGGPPLESAVINVQLANTTLETISVTGLKLAVRRGLTLGELGLAS
jgi:hypothetical protein